MIDLFKSKFFYFLLVLILLPIQITLGVYLYFAPEIPSSSEVASVELQVPLKIFTKDEKLIGEFGEIHRTKLKFEEIPDTFVKAFLAAEDSDYFNHTGVDILSLVRAAYQFLREGEIVSGGGTITMQVARNYVLTKERTFERKLKEIFTALKIDFSFTKEEIFELYVNQIFLGNRAYGIKAAAEIYYDKSPPPSILQVPKAKNIAVEFTSMSKTFSMAGWRVGFAVGNKHLINALTRIKSYLDYGAFTPVQVAAVEALNSPKGYIDEIRNEYKKRRDTLISSMARAGWDIPKPSATMFAWAPLPKKFQNLGSMEFAKILMQEAEVAVAPGIGFGEYGEGFVRIGLVENEHRIRQAAKNVKKLISG